jgi:hypothetical protein
VEAQALVVTSIIVVARVVMEAPLPVVAVAVAQALLEMVQAVQQAPLTHQMAVLEQDGEVQPVIKPHLLDL